jgi:hypothetical protein
VYGDDKLLWKSEPVMGQADGQKCTCSVEGVKELKLTVSTDGDPGGAFAVWVEPYLEK